MAEACFTKYVKDNHSNKFEKIDSAGTAGYHIGDFADARSIECCKLHDVTINHLGRQLQINDFKDFDWMLVMDESNYRDCDKLKMKYKSKVNLFLFGEFDEKGERIIKDPYYGGIEGFENNYQQIMRSSKGFCKHLGLE
jgi:low molecular weight phosphotyrosine protein phosphatase